MNLLLDTHILLWWLGNSPQLSTRARQLIGGSENIVHVSVVSLWEIAVKKAKGKLTADVHKIYSELVNQNFRVLPVLASHVFAVNILPLYHHDPFDRMLLAQAIAEPLIMITHDQTLQAYSHDLIILV